MIFKLKQQVVELGLSSGEEVPKVHVAPLASHKPLMSFKSQKQGKDIYRMWK